MLDIIDAMVVRSQAPGSSNMAAAVTLVQLIYGAGVEAVRLSVGLNIELIVMGDL